MAEIPKFQKSTRDVEPQNTATMPPIKMNERLFQA